MAIFSTKDYDVVEQIRGSLSQVVRRRRDGAALFVRRAKLVTAEDKSQEAVARRKQQTEELLKIDHTNLLRVFNSFEESDMFHLVVEYVGTADSMEKLIFRQENAVEPFTEDLISMWCLQLAKGLSYLHENGMIHRDVKPSTVQVIAKKKVKLSGFGFVQSYRLEDCQKAALVGTPAYWAPEIVKEAPYDFKVDSWALGIVLFQLAKLRLPFDISCSLPDLFQQIVNDKAEKLPDTFSHEFQDLVAKLIECEAKKRLTAAEAAEHLFLSLASVTVEGIGFEHSGPNLAGVSRNYGNINQEMTSKRDLEKIKRQYQDLQERFSSEEQARKRLEEENKDLNTLLKRTKGLTSRDDYVETVVLGKGAFSRIVLANRLSDSAEFAVKQINLTQLAGVCKNEIFSKKLVESTINDADHLANLQHPNIARIFCSFQESNHKNKYLYIAMEPLDQTNLEAAIQSRKGKHYQEPAIHHWAKQLFSVIKYLHDLGFLHCNIKAKTVLLAENKKMIKLGHFELVKEINQLRRQTLFGDEKLDYNAPELWRDEPYTEKTDVWALGVLLYQITCLEPPFSASIGKTLMASIVKQLPKPIPESYTADLQSFIKKLLSKSAEKRLSMSEAMTDPFIAHSPTMTITDALFNN